MLKHRSDYQTPSCNVLSADLDIRIFQDRTLVTTVLKLERAKPQPWMGETSRPEEEWSQQGGLPPQEFP